MTEKRVSPGKIILLIVAVLLLLLIGFAGYVYIRSSRQIVENDDVKDLLQQEPMDIADRYVVDEEGNLVCRLDKSDLYYYLEKSYGSGAADEMIADLEKETGLDVEAFTVDLEEPSFSLAASTWSWEGTSSILLQGSGWWRDPQTGQGLLSSSSDARMPACPARYL